MRSVFAFLVPLAAASCAAPAVPAPAAPPADPAVAEIAAAIAAEPLPAAPAPEALKVPAECGQDSAEGICSPPLEFGRRLCRGFGKPEVALALFAKGSPWTRGYLRLKLDAWYTGGRAAKVTLKFDEEVIVLYHPLPARGIVVGGQGAPFDVIRLDGACATLTDEELTLKRPPSPKYPVVPWRQFDPRVRVVLLADAGVASASNAYEEGCREASAQVCTKAGGKLTAAVLDFMARGGKIPMPPVW